MYRISGSRRKLGNPEWSLTIAFATADEPKDIRR